MSDEMKNNHAVDFDMVRFAALSIYSAFGIYLFPHFRHHIFTDGVSYISIAKKYLSVGFPGAVSGHWSPGISWLLAPFLHFGMDPADAFNIINIMTCFFLIVELRKVLNDLRVGREVSDATLILSVPVFLWMAYCVMSPDALVVLVMIRYFRISSGASCFTGKYGGIAAGATAGIGFFIKTYVLAFFFLHFTIAGLYHYFKNTDAEIRKKIAANFVTGIIAASIIASFWVVKLYERYSRLTIGTSGNYNYTLMFSEVRGEPVLYRGFFPPSDPAAISAWEDPPTNPVGRNPYLNPKDLASLASFFSANLADSFRYYFEWSVFSIPILSVSFLMTLLYAAGKLGVDEKVPFYTISAIIYPCAYYMLLVEERYVWINKIILMALGSYILTFVFERKKPEFSRAAKYVIAALLALTFCAEPLFRLHGNFNSGKDFFELSETLGLKYKIAGNLASDSRWADNLCLSYFLGARYYGQPAPTWSSAKTAAEVSKSGIDYFLVWNRRDEKLLAELDRLYKKVPMDERDFPLIVYKIRN